MPILCRHAKLPLPRLTKYYLLLIDDLTIAMICSFIESEISGQDATISCKSRGSLWVKGGSPSPSFIPIILRCVFIMLLSRQGLSSDCSPSDRISPIYSIISFLECSSSDEKGHDLSAPCPVLVSPLFKRVKGI